MLEKLWFLILFPGVPLVAFFVAVERHVKRRNLASRRPFLHMPRPAGWSLYGRIEDLVGNLLLHTMLLLMVGFGGWIIWLFGDSLAAGLVFSAVGSVWIGRLLWKNLISYGNHKLGLAGELVVGGVLDRLSSDTLRIFHDLEIKLPGKKPWNIDHVALTPAGVFVFETKTRRKPKLDAPDAKGQKGHQVVFDGVHLHFPHPMRPDRHGIEQTTRNATWLKEKLTALNGTDIPVTAALVLPGWYVKVKAPGAVSVLNEKQIAGYLDRRPVLSEERLRALNAQLGDMAKVEFG